MAANVARAIGMVTVTALVVVGSGVVWAASQTSSVLIGAAVVMAAHWGGLVLVRGMR